MCGDSNINFIEIVYLLTHKLSDSDSLVFEFKQQSSLSEQIKSSWMDDYTIVGLGKLLCAF